MKRRHWLICGAMALVAVAWWLLKGRKAAPGSTSTVNTTPPTLSNMAGMGSMVT